MKKNSNINLPLVIVLSIIILLILVNCQNVYDRDNSSSADTIKNEQVKHSLILDTITDSGISPIFIKSLKLVFDSCKIYLRPELGRNEIYFSVKFFKINNDLCFYAWGWWFFPDILYSSNGSTYDIDPDNMYYYKIRGHNVIIIDYPSSQGYGLFEKNTEKHKQALIKKQEFETFVNKYGVRISDEPVFRITCKVILNEGEIKIVKLPNVIEAPPYSSEE